jgi:hypothetical protein
MRSGETGARHATTVDVNGDGIKDIAVANIAASTNSVTIMTGNGNGSFGTPYTVPGSLFTFSIAAGNFD